jgi:hypothetical protein
MVAGDGAGVSFAALRHNESARRKRES